ncbi:response regulator [Leptolyngbya sp. NIES-2104]|uniref:response regulator n=1 Tax=Leptolyngbya sp. NIES-2104 TaxID=1552121 RepID=UPI00073EA7DD|nr:response regulator [Leptolyngbya sp. NIES-2104]
MIPHRTVLIVEDSETDRYIFRRYLMADPGVSYTILESPSAADGLALCRNRLPDGILLDIKLPDCDGFEFLSRLKAQIQGTCPPVVVVSCYNDATTAAIAFKNGVEDYFVKGQTNPDKMRSAMRSAIENAELRRRLQQSEERFRTSIENLLDCFGIFSAIRDDAGQIIDFRIDYLNRVALQNHWLSDTAIDQTLSEVFPRYRDSSVFKEHCQIVETGEPNIKEAFPLDLLDNGSLMQFYDVRSSKLNDGLVLAWRDVTDRVRAETEREQLLSQAQIARAEAEAANHSKDEFLAIVAHELRAPLNSMFGWAKLLQAKPPNADTLIRALQSIERSAKNQLQLIEDLLDISRMVRGELRIDRVSTQLGLVVEAAIDMIRPLAEAKQILVISDIDHTANEVLGDSNRLQQVVWNLLINAVKFTPEQGKIAIALTYEESQAAISVSDTGKGINVDFLPYVFDRFRQAQTNAPRSQDGLGLGLAITRELVDLHEGTIAVTSGGEGQGATFIVRLPLIQASSLDSQHLQGLNGLKVLLIDDEPDSLEFVQFYLEHEGAIVATATSADEAIETFQTFCPAIVISDISMPHKDGYQLLQEIRALSVDQTVPAIALTAHVNDDAKQQAFAAGYRIHLSKPLDIEQLFEAITALVKRS